MTSPTTIYEFSFTSLAKQPIPLADYQGKVILIVNTASQCGLAKQYKGLQLLQEKYHPQGFTIIGVASQDFGNQEYTDPCKIKINAQQPFSITFPLTTITPITGNKAHPFYLWARQKVGWRGSPKWNFHKYLISRQGVIINWYGSITSPTANRLIKGIEKALQDTVQSPRPTLEGSIETLIKPKISP